MKKFDKIYQRALDRKGGEQGLAAWLPDTVKPKKLSAIPADRWLAEMTRCIFQAGFVYRVINHKWPGFEEAFWGFVPEKMILLSPEQLENLSKDTRIVRNLQKILTVPKNAQMILDVEKEGASFGDFIAQWPSEDTIGLLHFFKQRGNRLGGMTGQRVLRNMGKDTFVLTSDVIRCLLSAGLEISANPTSQTDMRAIQAAFNTWQQESDLPLSHISRICACSVGENYTIDD